MTNHRKILEGATGDFKDQSTTLEKKSVLFEMLGKLNGKD